VVGSWGIQLKVPKIIIVIIVIIVGDTVRHVFWLEVKGTGGL
jgi:hypothetical protein